MQTRLGLIPYTSTPEIKENKSGKYLYIRKRELGKLKSIYVDKFSDELYQTLLSYSKEAREINKEIRKIMITINNENLVKIIEIVAENDKELVEIVFNIVVKINNLPSKTKTTIAKLIDYNPNNALVSPLLQGKISRYVKMVCKEIGIELERTNDSIGGLAYFDEFIKC